MIPSVWWRRFAVLLIVSLLSFGVACSRQEPAKAVPAKVVMPISKPAKKEAAPAPTEQVEQEPVDHMKEDPEQSQQPPEMPGGSETAVSTGTGADKVTPPEGTEATIGQVRVQEGDSLARIAGRMDVYDDPLKWPSLYLLNMDKLAALPAEGDFDKRELPSGMELQFVESRGPLMDLDELAAVSWVVNVRSAPRAEVIVPSAVKLMNNGYHVYIVRATVKGQDYLRLRVGFFKSRREAQTEGKRISQLLRIKDSWVTRARAREVQEYWGY